MLALTLLASCFDALGVFEEEGFAPYLEKAAFYRDPQTERLYLYISANKYVLDSSGVHVLDVTDPQNIQWLNTIFVEDTVGPYDTDIEDPIVIDTFLYFIGDEANHPYIFVFSLKPDPTSPKYLWRVPLFGKEGKTFPSSPPRKASTKDYMHGFPWEYVPEERMLYYLHWWFGYLFAIDVSDPAHPRTLNYERFTDPSRGDHGHFINYPYFYWVQPYVADTTGLCTVVVYIYELRRDTFKFISKTSNSRVYSSGFIPIRTQDSSRMFLLFGDYFLDVTDPEEPVWRSGGQRIPCIGMAFTPDKGRVYCVTGYVIRAIQANGQGGYIVCQDSLEQWGPLTWYNGLIYMVYLTTDTGHLVILQYPEDNVSESPAIELSKFKVPTFQKDMLKVISPKEGWFDLKLFSSTGALVAKRRVYLKKGVNLVDIGSLKPSGVYFLKIGKDGKPFKLVFLTGGR
mgnify:CR=1 FL=1